MQLLDREWKVRFQAPDPGLVAVAEKVDLGAVELGEKRPAEDTGPVSKVADGGTTPNRGGQVARGGPVDARPAHERPRTPRG